MTLFTSDAISLSLSGRTQADILNELAAMAVRLGNVTDAKAFSRALAIRESQGSTGFGDGVALPHTRSACILQRGSWLPGRRTCFVLVVPDDPRTWRQCRHTTAVETLSQNG